MKSIIPDEIKIVVLELPIRLMGIGMVLDSVGLKRWALFLVWTRTSNLLSRKNSQYSPLPSGWVLILSLGKPPGVLDPPPAFWR